MPGRRSPPVTESQPAPKGPTGRKYHGSRQARLLQEVVIASSLRAFRTEVASIPWLWEPRQSPYRPFGPQQPEASPWCLRNQEACPLAVVEMLGTYDRVARPRGFAMGVVEHGDPRCVGDRVARPRGFAMGVVEHCELRYVEDPPVADKHPSWSATPCDVHYGSNRRLASRHLAKSAYCERLVAARVQSLSRFVFFRSSCRLQPGELRKTVTDASPPLGSIGCGDQRTSAVRSLGGYLLVPIFFCPMPVLSYLDAKQARARR
jgi:hypothetical protein